jgi:hypothetical protein
VQRRQNVAVGVESGHHSLVPEEILDHLGVGAGFQQDRGSCMSKIVNRIWGRLDPWSARLSSEFAVFGCIG